MQVLAVGGCAEKKVGKSGAGEIVPVLGKQDLHSELDFRSALVQAGEVLGDYRKHVNG